MSIIRHSVRRVTAVAAIVLPLFTVAQASAAAAVPTAKTVVSIPLSSTWKVTAYSQLVITDGTMTCTWRSMTRVAPKAATAVSLNCVGPKNAYGLAYPLTLSRPALHLSKQLTVRFPRFTAGSVTSLLSYAPLEVPISGVAATLGSVSMVGPKGWGATAFSDAVRWQSPGFSSPSTGCELFVLKAVRPDPAALNPALTDAQAEALLDIQLLAQTQTLFSTTLTGPYGNANPRYDHRYGTTGYGDPFVSLTLDGGGVAVKTTMILAPTAKFVAAITIVENGDLCQLGYKYEVPAALLQQSIRYAGQLYDLHPFDKQMLGMWGSTDGHIATADVFGANGHYIFAYAYNGTINISGKWYDATYSFAGDGMYSVYGPVVSFFPLASGRAPYSRLFYVYHEVYGTVSSRHICQIAKGTNPATYMSCDSFWR
jgi:hypothetical protein